MTTNGNDDFLSPDEGRVIALAALCGHERCYGTGLTESEIDSVLRWARRARIQSATLDGILAGAVEVAIEPNGSLRFLAASERTRDLIGRARRESSPAGEDPDASDDAVTEAEDKGWAAAVDRPTDADDEEE
jgi:hypothetical protein